MRKNLLVQLIFRVVLCTISAFACLLSLGVFYIGSGGKPFDWNFLKFYTNLSNYCVFVVSVAVLAETVKKVKQGEREGYVEKWRNFKFMTVVMILVTFLVVIFLLNYPWKIDYWLDIGNMSYHFAAPILFIMDYLLFDQKRTLSFFVPLLSLVLPLLYVGYIFFLGAVIPEFSYPYFFLDVNSLGYGGVCLWVLILLIIFTILGYLLWLWNRFDRVNGKWKFDFHGIFAWRKGNKSKSSEEEEII